MNEPVISARGLRLAFGTTQALAGVDLDLFPGEALAVMGASGSGKSTLLHCLAGVLAPASGTISLVTQQGVIALDSLTHEGRAQVRRERFGFVFQAGLLLPELTIRENVAVPLMLNGVGRREAELNAASWLDAVGLAGMHDRRPGQLSGGQLQRAAIARSQVTSPLVTFADEPTGALDSTTAHQVLDVLIGSTVGQGRSLVIVTHDPSVAARCQRTIRLADGLEIRPFGGLAA